MPWTLYLRLIVLTAGTLLPFFWMVVILGHRRQRNFERLFFFLCLALTCFFGSSLLALNAALFYTSPPEMLLRFAWTFLCLGLWFVPLLIVHLHAKYGSIRELIRSRKVKIAWLLFAWLPAVLLATRLLAVLKLQNDFRFESPSAQIGLLFQVWLMTAILTAAYWQQRFTQAAPDDEQRAFHKGGLCCAGALDAELVFVGSQSRGKDFARLLLDGFRVCPLSALEAVHGGTAVQFFADWQATKPDLCGADGFSGAFVPEFRAPGELVARSLPAAGGFRSAFAFLACGVF